MFRKGEEFEGEKGDSKEERLGAGVVSSVYPVRGEGGGVEAKTRVTEQGDRRQAGRHRGGSLL